jgi:hypothetical protein
MEANVTEILRKAGFKFSKRNWPKVSVTELEELGITVKVLEDQYRKACLYESEIGHSDRIKKGSFNLVSRTGQHLRGMVPR